VIAIIALSQKAKKRAEVYHPYKRSGRRWQKEFVGYNMDADLVIDTNGESLNDNWVTIHIAESLCEEEFLWSGCDLCTLGPFRVSTSIVCMIMSKFISIKPHLMGLGVVLKLEFVPTRVHGRG